MADVQQAVARCLKMMEQIGSDVVSTLVEVLEMQRGNIVNTEFMGRIGRLDFPDDCLDVVSIKRSRIVDCIHHATPPSTLAWGLGVK